MTERTPKKREAEINKRGNKKRSKKRSAARITLCVLL